jgi:hypothetical protein
MKKFVGFMLVAVFMLVATPVYSASVSQFFKCEQDDDASNHDLEAFASKWRKAVTATEEGKHINVFLFYPVAAAMGETDFWFVVTAPTLTDWATFSDSYAGSEASKMDGEWDELAACPDSALWRSVKVE